MFVCWYVVRPQNERHSEQVFNHSTFEHSLNGGISRHTDNQTDTSNSYVHLTTQLSVESEILALHESHLNASNEFSMSNANEIEIYCLHFGKRISNDDAKYSEYILIRNRITYKNNTQHAFVCGAISL